MISIFECSHGQKVLLEQRGEQIFADRTEGKTFENGIVVAENVKYYVSGTVYKDAVFFLYLSKSGQLILRNVYDRIVYYQAEVNEELLSKKQIQAALVDIGEKLVIIVLVCDKYDSVKLVYPFERELDRTITGEDRKFLDLKEKFQRMETEYQTKLQENEQELKNRLQKEQELLLGQKNQEIFKLQSMLESAKKQYSELMEVATRYRDEAIRWRSKFL